MQDFYSMNPSDKTAYINGMVTNTQYEMVDKRDNKTYYVAKLADGNVWMTENLDFDINSGITYTPEDTDVKSNWKPSNSTTTSSGSANNLSSSDTPASYDGGNYCWTGTVTRTASTGYNRSCSQHDSSHYHIGNFYNFSAAVAMNNTSGYTSSGYDMNQSICPAGWRLPPNSGSKSYENLYNSRPFTTGSSGSAHKAPLYFAYVEFYSDSSRVTYSLFQHLWTSTVYSNSSAYYLLMNIWSDGFLDLHYCSSRSYFESVRCVAR